MALLGLDVSRHQGTIFWSQVKAAGHVFAFCKCTDSTSYRYVYYFKQQAPQIRAAGLVLGAYHWLSAHTDPRAQAEYFVRTLRETLGNLDNVLCALDVERGADGSIPTAAQARAFASQFAILTHGHPLIVYTGRWFWVGILGNPHGASIGPLWHSEYELTEAEVADGPELDAYGGWSRATFWQYTSSGRCPGVSGSVDLNLFFGSRSDLEALAESPDDTEDEMTPEDREWITDQLALLEYRIIRQVTGTQPLVVAFDDVNPGDPDHWYLVPGVDRTEVTQDEAAQRVAEGTARWWGEAGLPLRVPRPTLESVPLNED